jgi:hypothetical protein
MDVDAERVDTDATVAIYSTDSDGELTPTGLRPRLPQIPPSNQGSELCRVDLVVSAEGEVESVKLLGAPCTVRESMFLSAARHGFPGQR